MPRDHLTAWELAAADAVWQRIVWGRNHPIAMRARAEAKRCRDLYLAMSPRRDRMREWPWRETARDAWKRIGVDASDKVVALRVAA
jgi:hypothetical protein